MKQLLALALALLIVVPFSQAAPTVEAIVAKDQESKPTNTFPSDVPKIYAFFRSKGTKKGDSLRAVWIADDVGDAAPKGTKIDETTITADQDDFYGAASLSKPTKGWPIGEYHVDIYYGDQVATTVKFTISGDKAEKSDKKKDKDDDDDDD
ncbi:MAG TPA: hypothetical protein VGC85_06305 [Chthoniobacterales bacterium]|jgi:hypothetical protein